MVKISNFIIGIILVSLVVTVLGVYMKEGSDNYGVEYDNDSIAVYNKLDDLNTQTEDIQDSVESMKERTGVLDVVGSFFADAYKSLKVSLKSYDLVFGGGGIGDQALKDANLGETTSYFRIALSLIVLIALLFVIVRAVVKVDI